MTEVQAFWVFCALIEDIVPTDYYSRSMIGSRMDQMVFESSVAWKLPKLHAMFKEINMLLEPVTCPWILCLYTTALPMEYVCRIWDCLLWEGNVVLFRVGLAMLKSKEQTLLQADDFIEVYSILRSAGSTAYDVNTIQPIPEPVGYAASYKRSGSGKGGLFSSSSSDKTKSVDSTGRSNSIFSLGSSKEQLYLSKLDTLMYSAFDKTWLKSIPRDSILRMRNKFRTLLNKQNEEKQAQLQKESATITVPKGIAHDHGAPQVEISMGSMGNSNDEDRQSIHATLLKRYVYTVYDIYTVHMIYGTINSIYYIPM